MLVRMSRSLVLNLTSRSSNHERDGRCYVSAGIHGGNDRILFGGCLDVKPCEEGVGQILFERLKQKSRAQNILQVDATTGKEVTTSEYFNKSVAVAQGLKRRGIRGGDMIMVLGKNGINMNIALTGIFLSGAVSVPISTHVNSGSLRAYLKNIKPSCYVCDEETLFTLNRIVTEKYGRPSNDDIVVLDDPPAMRSNYTYFVDLVEEEMKEEGCMSFQPEVIKDARQELAIVMKGTVGDAGRLVGLTHHSLNHIFARYDHFYGPEVMSEEVILQAQKITWMSGIYSLLLSCYYGSKTVVVSDFDEETVLRSLEKYKVTWSFLYPGRIWQLYKHRSGTRKYDVSSCRNIYGVGSGLSRDLIIGMEEKLGMKLKSAYGKTEVGGIVIDPTMGTTPGSVGKLVPECFAKVVSTKTGKAVGVKVPGELCFQYAGAMKEYIGDDSATKQVIDEDGFLHSGDYGSYDDQGFIYYFEQIGDVIHYKDFEISPQEIEDTVKCIESVLDAVVGGIANSEGERVPIAFVVTTADSKLTAQHVQQFVADKLEDHKRLRGGVVFISRVPRNKETEKRKRHIISRILSRYRLKVQVTTEIQPAAKKEGTLSV